MIVINLRGKIALVTGSSRGLGRHYALHLARAGADVIIHDVNESAAAEFGEAPSGPAVTEEIRALGRRCAFFSADLTDPVQAEKLVHQALEVFGHNADKSPSTMKVPSSSSLVSSPEEQVHDETQLQSGSMCTCQDYLALVYSILVGKGVSLVSSQSLTMSFSC